jgi:hypothetical protein
LYILEKKRARILFQGGNWYFQVFLSALRMTTSVSSVVGDVEDLWAPLYRAMLVNYAGFKDINAYHPTTPTAVAEGPAKDAAPLCKAPQPRAADLEATPDNEFATLKRAREFGQ